MRNNTNTSWIVIIILQIFFSLSCLAEQDLATLIKKTEQGVFFLRVNDTNGKVISTGTGFLIDKKGTLLTALHVILPQTVAVGSIEAVSADGKKWPVNSVLKSDSSVDLVALKLSKSSSDAIPVPLSMSPLPERGSKVIVIGHPQGFQFVASDGIVSATHRTDKLPAQIRSYGFITADPEVRWIQTTAAISRGNSGGPLLDSKGRTIGMVQWVTRGQSMNFALEVNAIHKLLAMPEKIMSLKDFTQAHAEFNLLTRNFRSDYALFNQQQSMSQMMGLNASSNANKQSDPHPFTEYIPKYLALAKTYTNKEIEFKILKQVMLMASDPNCPNELDEDIKNTVDRLLKQYRNDRRLIPVLQRLRPAKLSTTKDFLKRLAYESNNHDIRSIAGLLYAMSLDLNIEEGKNREVALKAASIGLSNKSNTTFRTKNLRDISKNHIDMVKDSTLGSQAPKLIGVDQNGKKIDLSKLKEEYAIALFYTKSSEYFGHISQHLNELHKHFKDAPVTIIGILIEPPNSSFRSSGKAPVKKTWSAIKDDKNHTLINTWHIADSPTAFIINKKGQIAGRYIDRQPPQNQRQSFFPSFGKTKAVLPTWANTLIERLHSLDHQLFKLLPVPKIYPDNSFYKMTSTNKVRESVDGKKILVTFEQTQAIPPNKSLRLVLKCDTSRGSETKNTIHILKGSKGETLTSFTKINRGQVINLDLDIPPHKTIEIAIVNNDKDSVRFKHFGDRPLPATGWIPEFFLQVVDKPKKKIALDFKDQGEWISSDATYTSSSRYKGSKCKPNLLTATADEGDYAFHTKNQKKPYVIIDLRKIKKIKSLYIMNRKHEGLYWRATGLTLWLSKTKSFDDKHVWQATKVEKEWMATLPQVSEARYLKLGLLGYQRTLHLSQVKVFADKPNATSTKITKRSEVILNNSKEISELDLKAQGKWISSDATYTVSSKLKRFPQNPSLLTDKNYSLKPSFHTKVQKNPYIIIDLGKVKKLKSLYIMNTPVKEYHWRTNDLTLWLSKTKSFDDSHAWQATEIQKDIIATLPQVTEARYLKLGLIGDQRSFHLHKIKVFDDKINKTSK